MKPSSIVFVVLVATIFCTITVDGGLYIRWGRTKCPADNSVIYTGYMVTEYYSATGGGRNMLCVTDHPEWGRVNNNGAGKVWGTGLHGVQYWFGAGYTNNAPFSYENYNNQDIYQHTAPCVMCYTSRVDVAMIPGLLHCPGDLTTEYSGYIVANDYRNQASEFICLDQAPEVAASGGFASTEGLLCIAEFGCGALPCPNPFVQWNQASCAVCSV